MRLFLMFQLIALSGFTLVLQAQNTVLVSGLPQPSSTAGPGSFQPSLSADGRFVVFSSFANNLTPNSELLPFLNVFLRDRVSGQFALISVNTNGNSGGNGHSVGASISTDGRFVAFQSTADNLANNDTNGVSDVFLRDRQSGSTTLVSRQLDGRTSRFVSGAPQLSVDGRFVVFESHATNLVANDTNAAPDIFVFDRVSGVNSLVSLNVVGNGSRAGGSVGPTITSDGQWIAFVNYLSNSSPTIRPTTHVYVRHQPDGPVQWASSNAVADLPNYLGATAPSLSADGHWLYFHAFNSITTNLYQFDTDTRSTRVVATAVNALSAPSPSADGRLVAFERDGLVVVWDAQSGNETIASVTLDDDPAPSKQDPARPILSADGAKVTFLSRAGGLTGEATNGFVQLYQRDLVASSTMLLSRDATGAASGDLSSVYPAATSDGAIVAFESDSGSMVSNDLNAAPDIFVRDTAAGLTTLISGTDAGMVATASAGSMLYRNSISADGRTIVFGRGDLGPETGDTNGVQDIFVRNLATGVVQPISVSASGAFTNQFPSEKSVISADGRRVAWIVGQTTYYGSSAVLWGDLQTGETLVLDTRSFQFVARALSAPAISADGRWVAFETWRNVGEFDPAISDPNGAPDILLHDVIARTNVVISKSATLSKTGSGSSTTPTLSPDGRWLAFLSTATDLVEPPAGGPRLFLRDLVRNVTLDVSGAATAGGLAFPSSYSGRAIFSADSRYIAYETADNCVGLYDQMTGLRSNVCNQCSEPTISGDGRWLAVRSFTGNAMGGRILLSDRLTGRSELVGTNIGVNGMSFLGDRTRSPILSADGRYLIFLVERAFDSGLPTPVLYVRDLVRGFTVPLPVDLRGGSGNGATYVPQLAANGRTLAFVSFASDLASGDYNTRRDVFAVTIGSPDSDGDGLDDDWEVAYFGNLDHNGQADSDGDGMTDASEFRAGTDPTNLGSVLSVFITGDGHAVTITWNSVPGRTYDVQYKDRITDSWSTMFASVEATGSTRSVAEIGLTATNRFYRVVFAP